MNRKNRILVVDDDEDVVTLLRHHLSSAGYKVQHALGGLEGLQLAIGEAPDLIVSDILMPELDGFGLLAALRANTSTCAIPIVFLTILDDEESLARAMRLGVDDYLTKPVRREALLTSVAGNIGHSHNGLLGLDGEPGGGKVLQAAGDDLLLRDFRHLRRNAARIPAASQGAAGG